MELKLNFSEEEMLVFFAEKGMKPKINTVVKLEHRHGSHFEEYLKEEWVILYEDRVQPMEEVFVSIIKEKVLSI